jgi:hypothetical protein
VLSQHFTTIDEFAVTKLRSGGIGTNQTSPPLEGRQEIRK